MLKPEEILVNYRLPCLLRIQCGSALAAEISCATEETRQGAAKV
jgi:hypothetical protein